MKRRLILSAHAVPGRGGQGVNLEQMIEALADEFALTLFSLGTHPACACHVVPPSRLAEALGRLPGVRRWRDWQGYLGDRHFDAYVAARLPVADVFQGVTGQCALSFAAARRRGGRVALDVITEHVDGFLRVQAQECPKFGVRAAFHPRQVRRMRTEFAQADAVRVMSRVAQRSFTERGFAAERVRVVHPFVRVEEFPVARFADPGFRILFVGLIEPWKGFQYLVDAFAAFPVPEAELVFWGGPGARSISDYFRDRQARDPRLHVRPESVRAAGFAEVYGRASVLVLPSLTDGFGLVVAEAMASGLPVIVSRAAGAADWVEDGVNGFLVDPAEAGQIAERLGWLAAHRDRLRALGAAARATAARFTAATFRAAWLPALADLPSVPPRSP